MKGPGGRPATTPESVSHGAALRSVPAESPRVSWGFIGLYVLAYTGTSLLFLAPLLVSVALKVNDLVGIGAGRLSDRTSSPRVMRRPWMVAGLAAGSLGILTVALAPDITVVLLGWCTGRSLTALTIGRLAR